MKRTEFSLVVFCFRTFPCKTKFHVSRDHLMMVRDTSFKSTCFRKTRFEIYKLKIVATWIF